MIKRGVLTIFWLVCAAFAAAAQTPSASPAAPPFQSLRYDEDYSYLKNEAERQTTADKLKYIPLGRENWYASLGGEARLRYETYRNAAFGAGAQDGNGYFLQRYLLHADFHFGKKLRVFTQLQSGLVSNRSGGARPTDKDKLDLHQAFFDYKIYAGEKRSLTVRLGRQEIEFGSGRLISASEGVNVRRSFDAARIIYKQNKWTANGLFFKLVSTDKGLFDDQAINNQTFWGVGAIRTRKQGGIAFYYFGLDRRSARFRQGAAREIRQTFGSRVWGNYKKFDYNYEIIGQTGNFGNAAIRAWALATDSGLNFPKIFSRFGLKSNLTSGDRNIADRKLQSFNPLFPGTAYSGAIALIGPTNIADLNPGYRFNRKKLTFTVDASFYRRQSKNDGLYGINVNLLKNGNAADAAFVGSLVSARGDFRFNRHLTWTTVYSHFFAGQFIKDNPPGKDVEYFFELDNLPILRACLKIG